MDPEFNTNGKVLTGDPQRRKEIPRARHVAEKAATRQEEAEFVE
jgi:hypothetical protein